MANKKTKSYTPPCQTCGGRCCKYVALGIDPPKNKTNRENIRWYLLHKNVAVFVDHDKDWFVEFSTPCEAQAPDQTCTLYERRPKICRDYGRADGECEFYDSPYHLRFETLEQFETWLESKKRKVAG